MIWLMTIATEEGTGDDAREFAFLDTVTDEPIRTALSWRWNDWDDFEQEALVDGLDLETIARCRNAFLASATWNKEGIR